MPHKYKTLFKFAMKTFLLKSEIQDMEQIGFQNKSLVSIISRILLLLINNSAFPFFVFKSRHVFLKICCFAGLL